MAEDIFSKADIDKAVREAVSRAEEGLRDKRDELLEEVKKLKADLRKTKEIDPGDLTAAEERAEKAEARVSELEKGTKTLAADLEKATQALESETGFSQKMLIDNGLNTALAEAGVKEPGLLKAVKAMMARDTVVALDGTDRKLMMGDQTLGDAVKAWAGSDEARYFISAPNNSGGGSVGGTTGGGSATMQRGQWQDMQRTDPSAANKFVRDGGKIIDATE